MVVNCKDQKDSHVGDEAESELLDEQLENPTEHGIVTSFGQEDVISGDGAESKRCKVTVKHPEESSNVVICDDMEKTIDDTDNSEEDSLCLSENLYILTFQRWLCF